MLRKKISKLMALVMTITSAVSAVPAAEAKEESVFDGIQLLAGAYSPDLGMYAAIGNDQNSKSHIFYSEDGVDWTMSNVTTAAASTTAKNIAVWWPAQQCFVISNATMQLNGAVWTSTDGKTWKYNDKLGFGNNGDIQVLGDYLYSAHYSSKRAIKRYANLTDKATTIYYALKANEIEYNMNTIALSDDETPYVFAGGSSGGLYTVAPTSLNDDVEGTGRAYIDNKNGNSKMIDAHWNKTINKFVAVNPVQKNIYMFSKDKTWESLPVNAEAGTLAAIETNGSSYLTGDAKGNLFFANGTDLSASTTFSKVALSTENTLPVTNIFTGADGKYMVIVSDGTTSKIIVIKSDGSEDVKEDVRKTEFDHAKVLGSSFNGITLLAGAYSPDLGMYAAIGNDQNSKSHIFYSEDGVDWTMSNVTTAAASTTAKNIAVWWPAQQCFVISNATMQLNGAVWTSTDGKTWKYNDKLGFGNNGDIQVLGDYLYSAHYSSKRAIKRYANLTDKATTIYYALKANEIEYNMNTIALSDDETPYVFAGGSSGGLYTVAPTSLNDDVEGTGRAYIDNKNGNSKMIDAHWNKTINKFVAVNPVQKNIYMFSKDKTWESLPVNAEAGTLAAIETNGSSYLTGDAKGNLFFANGTDLSASTTFSKVAHSTENTLPVTNIFTGADGKYIVTVSDGTTSDVLIVNSDGSGYVKASEESNVASIKGGDEFKVSVKVANYGEAAQTVRLIAAIYDKSGTKLLQMVSDDKTMALNSTQYLELLVTANEDIPADATLKVFIWNSLGTMIPLTNGDNFF